jgi:uncharacterized protein (DUF1810 family)
MWFVFPQLRGLGRGPLTLHYGITGLAEAELLGVAGHGGG